MTEPHPEIQIVDNYGVVNGVLRTHEGSECALPYCAIHNPSGHPLRDAPQRWRNDLRILERICPHGYGHPDIDNLDCLFAIHGEMVVAAVSVHACDGCCGLFPPGGRDERGDNDV